MGKYDCLVCKKTTSTCASNKTGSIQCNVCDHWWHPPCVGVDAGQYDLIKKCIEMSMSSPWSCQVCISVWAKLNKERKNVASKVSVNEGKIASLEAGEVAVKEKVKDLEEKVKKLDEKMKETEKNSSESGEVRVLEEIAARNTKDRNLVLHGCAECDEDDSADNVERVDGNADMVGVQGLFDRLDSRLDAKQVLIGTRRLGRKSRDQPRPLLIIFKLKTDRDIILDRAPRLSREREEYWKNISIVADLTEKQSLMEKQLFKKAEESNLNRSQDETAKNLVWKVVGRRGERLLRQYELREQEMVNSEGRVVWKNSEIEQRPGKRFRSPQTGHSPPARRQKGGRFGQKD